MAHMHRIWCVVLVFIASAGAQELPANRWVQLEQDPAGARRGSAIRYAPEARAFFLWGFFDYDTELLQEHPLMEVPEYDMVAFDPSEGRWRSHFPPSREAEWSKKLPLAYIPRTYAAITTGSERTVLRGPTDQGSGAPRPDLNIVFDQVAYHPGLGALVYFTGGLTAAYDVKRRRWSDLEPRHSPPPVLGGSLAYDARNNEIVLFGGGYVAEPGPGGRVVGYTGTWVYKDGDWRRLPLQVQPPARTNTRLVSDTKNELLVVFGGDGQSHYFADTWIYDLKTRSWRSSKAPGPEARAGHFTVYDPRTGWVIVGGGYNRRDLTDMWAYDAAADRWHKLPGDVPTGFYLSADIAPERRLILLVTNTRKPGDRMTCNVLYPVRTTFGYRIEAERPAGGSPPVAQQPMPKLLPAERDAGKGRPTRLDSLPLNQWVLLDEPGRAAPTRTWGSATFDSTRGEILSWGGGHCGYGGSDVDAYSIESHTWRAADPAPEFPLRAWDKGVRTAGVTFRGAPWTDHGRKIFAYDPVSRKMIMARGIRLTTGYDPELLKSFPDRRATAKDALVNPPSSYVRYGTFTYDGATGEWTLIGSAPLGVDTLVTTRHGVMGLNVNWPSRLNDAGYNLPWTPSSEPVDTAIHLLDVAAKQWKRLGGRQDSPQNLYEMTSLAYDSKRDQVLLHGAGQRRDELWSFHVPTGRWKKLPSEVAAPAGAAPPVCSRESVYLPGEDALFIFGPAPGNRGEAAAWTYSLSKNAWRRVDIPFAGTPPPGRAGQNRAVVYDAKRDVILLVLGASGDEGKASVYALRYRSGS
jgi:hypothetical protein